MTREELYKYIPLDRETTDKFIDNCLNSNYGDYKTLEELLKHLIVLEFSMTIMGAFNWEQSPEGHDFWNSIAFREENTPKPTLSTADTIFELLDKLKSENREEYREVLDLLYSKTMEELYLDSGVENEH